METEGGGEMTASELYGALAARGLIPAQQKPPTEAELGTNVAPWYVQGLTGLSAWLAGLLLFAFIIFELRDVLLRDESWTILIAIGAGGCVAAAVLYATIGAKGQFAGQFALAVSFAGQFAIAAGLAEKGRARAAFWGMLVVEIVLILVMKNRLHRFLSTLFAVIAWALAMHEAIFGDFVRYSTDLEAVQGYRVLFSVLLWMLVWAPVAFGAIWLVRREASWMARGREATLLPVTNGLIAALSIAPMAMHPTTFWLALRVSTAEFEPHWAALWPLLAALLALLPLALAFAVRSNGLMGTAIVFALVEVSCFYYILGTTLLIKSVIMLLLGAVLLLAALGLRRARA
jgi:uncharacterized membrane protein